MQENNATNSILLGMSVLLGVCGTDWEHLIADSKDAKLLEIRLWLGRN